MTANPENPTISMSMKHQTEAIKGQDMDLKHNLVTKARTTYL